MFREGVERKADAGPYRLTLPGVIGEEDARNARAVGGPLDERPRGVRRAVVDKYELGVDRRRHLEPVRIRPPLCLVETRYDDTRRPAGREHR